MKKQRGKHQEPKTRITECALLYSPAENMCVLRSCVAKATDFASLRSGQGFPLALPWAAIP